MKRNVTITLDEHTARWARVEAARRMLTEDMQDGQELGGVRVVDPFAHQPATLD